MEQIKVEFASEKTGQGYEGQKYFDLIIRYRSELRSSKEALKTAFISVPNQAHITLNQLATIKT